jgi:AGCS family alanine or glycine:cation symporter
MNVFVNLLWGYHVLGLILATGVRLSVSTGFFQLRTIGQWIKFSLLPNKCQKKNGISSFGALSTALAGSIGTGNIVGVAAAISVGGAGAIFWMWISALFGMMTVFAEVVLSVKYKQNSGAKGAFAYIEKIGKAKALPFVYGIGCVLSSLSMGNMAQSNAVAVGLNSFGIPCAVTGAALGIFLFCLTKKGLSGVTKVTEKLVPLMTVLFFAASALCLIKFRQNIIPAFREILSSAFSLRAGLGGGMFLAMKIGISRGVFTNEAGLGSSSMAFCEVKGHSARELGYLGIFQVFVDTTVMCLITALCVLCSTKERSGEYLVLTAFENALGIVGKNIITICMVLFALATTTATCYYGRVGLDYISKGKLTFLFPYLFGAFAFLGSVMNIGTIFDFCDAFNGLMAIPNIIALAVLTPEVISLCSVRKRKGDPPENSLSDRH